MRSLFSNKDLIVPADVQQPVQVKSAQAIHFDSSADFVSGVELQLVKEKIGTLTPSKSIWFKTDGAWSNIHLLEYILSITGAADVYFCTWAISEEAITRFIKWKENGKIKEIFAVIDVGLRNRKPGIYSQAVNAFTNLKTAHCHAKATVVMNSTHCITFIGSANYTKNPRKEVGVILWDSTIAQANIDWIVEEIYGTE